MKLLKKSVMVRGIADVALIGCTSRGVSRCPLNLRFQRAYLWYVCALASVLLFVDLDAASSARFTHLSVEQGLSQSTVQAVLQDHIGFLWFGTEEGLNRYDGYTFVVFKHDPQDPKSLPDDIISVLYEDRKQQLWVGTEQGICLFDRRSESFTRIPVILNRVTGIGETPDGTLWVAVEGGGLFLRNPVTGVLASFQPDPRNPASLVSFEVTAMLVDHSSRLWVGTLNAGVDLFEPNRQNGTFIHHHHDPKDPKSLSHDEVWGLAEDKVGNLWVATYGGGLNVLDPKTGVFRHYRYQQGNPHSLPTDLLTCVFVDRSGRLWVGTDGAGVLQYDAASDRFLALSHDPSDPASLSQNVVRTIYDDIQGQIWVGTFLGGANLLKKPRRAFGYFNHSAMDPSSLSDPAVASFLEDTEGHIWLGTERGGLDRFDAQTETFIHYRFPASIPGGAAVMSLFQDRRGRIWIGTYRGGLGRFDPQGGKFVVYTHQPGNPKSLGNNEVWAIAENIDGGLWLGTNGGLDRFDTEQGIVTEHFKAPGVGGLVSVGVRSLLLDRQGDLWVGSFGGLNLLRRGSSRFVLYQHKDGDPHTLSNDAVVALYEDRKGWLWAGTLGGGLNRLDRATGEFISYKGFPSNVINGIQEDSSGRLWLSTNHGMSRFNPAIGSVENFDLTNGLQSLQFHLGASLRTRGGHILFGSTDGFYDFDPEAIKPDTYAPPVVFTSFRIFNDPVKLPTALSTLNEITLSYGDKVFSFESAALDYALPRRNRYSYLMEGFSDQWIQLGDKREVTFTNLDPGRYVFRIKASNSDGVWNEVSAAALRVIIQPPFWRTWWFQGLSAAVVVFTLITAHRLRVRRLTTDIAERKRAEEKLQYTEGLYRGAITAGEAVPYRHDYATNSYSFMGQGILQLTGYKPEEMTPARWRQIIEESIIFGDAGNLDWEEAVHKTRAGEFQRWRSDNLIRTRDGRQRWVADAFVEIRDEQGRPTGSVGILIDITERKQALEESEHSRRALLSILEDMKGAEQEVREGRARLASILDSAMDAVVTVDADQRIVLFNKSAEEMFRCRAEEVMGQRLELLISERFRAVHSEHIRALSKTGITGQRMGRLGVISGLRANGEEFPIEASISQTEVSGKKFYTVIVRDVTERERSEEALRQSEEKYRDLVENIADVIYASDENGIITYISPVIESISGYAASEVVGHSFTEFIIEEDLPALMESYGRTLAGHLEPLEYRVRSKSGEIRWIRSASRPVIVWDRVVGVRGVITDITERKRAEEALLQQEERFSYVVLATHDAIYDWEIQSGRVWRNEAYQAIYSPNEPIGTDETWWKEHIQPDDRRRVVESIEKAFRQKDRFWSDEYRFRRFDGSYATIIDRGYILYDQLGQPIRMIGAMTDISERKGAEDALRNLVAGTSAVTGEEFFAAFVRHLAAALQVRSAFMTEVIGAKRDRVQVLAAWDDNKLISTFEYDLVNTPCENVIQHRQMCYYPENVQALFPLDQDLVALHAVAYLAVPLFNPNAEAIGHIFVTNDKPLMAVDRAKALMNVFAARAAVELERERTELALSESEERFRTLIETMNEGILQVDNDDIIQFANEQFCEMVGYAREDLIGKIAYKLLLKEKDYEFIKNKNRLRQDHGSDQYEIQMRERSGEFFWVNISAAPVLDGSGAVVGSVGLHTDITERKLAEEASKRAEEALRESERRFSTVFYASPVAIAITRLSDGRIIEQNDSFLTMFGFTREEVVGHTTNELNMWVDPQDRPQVVKALREQGLLRNMEHRFRTKSGEVRTALSTFELIELDAEQCILTLSNDITERKQAELLQATLYQIAEKASMAENIQEFYAAVHSMISDLLPARNFYIAIHDPSTQELRFDYWVDEQDPPPRAKKLGKGLTEYILRTGEPLLASPERFEELVRRGEVEQIGAPSVDWLGVPLKTTERVLGAIVVQTYNESVRYGLREKEVLTFVAQHIDEVRIFV